MSHLELDCEFGRFRRPLRDFGRGGRPARLDIMLYLQYFKIFKKIGWDFWSEVPSLTLGFIAPHVDQESIVRVVGDRDSTMTQYQNYLYFNWLQVYKRTKASRTSSNCQSENTRQNLCIHFKFKKHCSLSHGLLLRPKVFQ